MLEEMIRSIVHKTIRRSYPHLKLPSAVCARIDAAVKLGGWYEYKLTVLDRFGSPDEAFPPLPGIKSKKQFEAGAVVAIALLYGELTPAIIGEVKL